MALEHPLVNRAWLTYQMDRNGNVRTILHVEPNHHIETGTLAESELGNVIREYLEKHSDIERADIEAVVR